jgi:uncharacterized membrane protein
MKKRHAHKVKPQPAPQSSSAQDATSASASPYVKPQFEAASDAFTAGLKRLVKEEAVTPPRAGARLRNYFLAGIITVGPIAATILLLRWVISLADYYVKPLIPALYLPETYLPFAIPGIGILFGIAGLTMIGFLAANLFGKSLIDFGEMVLDRMPIVRNIYRALKQIFESAVSVSGPQKPFQKVGLIEFPSKGLWSLVFVTGETSGEIAAAKPGGETDLLSVFMPTGVVPPAGFICFVPRRDVVILDMSAEDAAKIILSAGMVTPDHQARLKQLADKAAKVGKS